ncbi:hypothetical protein LTR87_017768 [Friedmanniomyces endolithicus]|nr:hypothetical protein LTR87_017768 [Friedmanniomyces endolithicus]
MSQENGARAAAKVSPVVPTPFAIDPSTRSKQQHWPLWHARHTKAPDIVPTTEDLKTIKQGPILRRRSSIRERIIHTHPSLSDSGPIELQTGSGTGRHLACVNPHWPEEDSYKRQNERDGNGEDPVVAPAGVGVVSSY